MNILKDTEYAYAVSYIKTLENKMLTSSDLQTLISAQNADDARQYLAGRGFTGETTEEQLKNELERAWTAAYEVCGEDTPIEILLYENDFHNLKTILKSIVAKSSWQNMVLSPSTVMPETIETAIKTKDMSILPEHLQKACEEAYKMITSTLDGQLTEILIDKAEHLEVQKRAEESKNEFLTGWAKLLITLTDFKTAYRCRVGEKSSEFTKNALICEDENLLGSLAEIKDYIKNKFPDADVSSISAFERWCDNKKLSYVKSAKRSSFGFEPIMAFLIGKTFEIQTLRIILACKENGLGEDIIRERLRDTYV